MSSWPCFRVIKRVSGCWRSESPNILNVPDSAFWDIDVYKCKKCIFFIKYIQPKSIQLLGIGSFQLWFSNFVDAPLLNLRMFLTRVAILGPSSKMWLWLNMHWQWRLHSSTRLPLEVDKKVAWIDSNFLLFKTMVLLFLENYFLKLYIMCTVVCQNDKDIEDGTIECV